MDLTIEDVVYRYMGESTSDDDWDRRCDEVKKANGGYPSFWHKVVVQSGLYKRVESPNAALILSDLNVEDMTETITGVFDAQTGEVIG